MTLVTRFSEVDAVKAKKIKRKVGDILHIDLGGGTFSVAVVLKEPLIAFYNCFFTEGQKIDLALDCPALFKLWVMNSAIESGRWRVVGNTVLNAYMEEPQQFFKQDPISKKYSLTVDGEDGQIVSKEACEGLERAAVWSAEHVEDRLRDFHAGVPNKWVESLKLV
jgi:hypothetical protein